MEPVEAAYRHEHGQVVASLIKLTGDSTALANASWAQSSSQARRMVDDQTVDVTAAIVNSGSSVGITGGLVGGGVH